MDLGSGSDGWSARQLLIARRLRARRTDLGLTQQQVVGRLLDRGVRTTNRGLSSLERGAGIDVAKLPELAAALDCTVTFLLGLTEDPHRWEPDAAVDGLPPRSRRAAHRPVRPVGSLILGAEVPDHRIGFRA